MKIDFNGIDDRAATDDEEPGADIRRQKNLALSKPELKSAVETKFMPIYTYDTSIEKR